MTLIEMMRFDKDNLIAVADEKRAGSVMKSEDVTKLVRIYNPGNRLVIWGATGGVSPTAEIEVKIKSSLKDKEDYTIEQVKEVIRKVLNDLKQKMLTETLESRFPGVNLNNIYTGKWGCEHFQGSISNILLELLFGKEKPLDFITCGQALLGTYDPEEGTELYKFDFEMGVFGYVPYVAESIGTGWFGADSILRPYSAKKKREGREKIPHLEGSIVMLQAYNNACELNEGVGGFPTIFYGKKGEVQEVDDNQARLASLLVNTLPAPSKHFTRNTRVEPWIEALLFEEDCLDDVMEQMRKKTKYHGGKKDHLGMMKFLAGLKQD